ncbi:helicase RepA family protein [Bradyrhizobium sp. Bra78]|uniref:helicase RepA family protein n=1 Tax=Bradyrhizobium sp. Bra78 TaxID=2926010 RepID=UPI0021C7F780|nr:helicase RepA family protein [Bradyrhizobium sp. Bra78]
MSDEIDFDDDKPKRFQYALPYKTFDQCAHSAPKTWLIENVIALGEDSSWYGPPGAGKSGLLMDLAVHVASGRDWRGYTFNRHEAVRERRGVVYFALERADLTERRLQAYMQRDGLSRLPIVVVPYAIDLLDPRCVEIIRHTLLQFWDDIDVMPSLVIVDTWGKAIARGDADKEHTQNLAAAHISQLRQVLKGDIRKFHLASIGHSGKNLAAGERGSNARQGHVDLEVQVNGGAAKITKANDQDNGELTKFEFEKVDMPGDDERNFKPWSIAILATGTPVTTARTASQRTTGKQTQALNALARVTVTHGQGGVVHPDYWKAELARDGLIRPEDKNPRATFARIRKSLSQHIIEEPTGLVRIKSRPGNIPECPA